MYIFLGLDECNQTVPLDFGQYDNSECNTLLPEIWAKAKCNGCQVFGYRTMLSAGQYQDFSDNLRRDYSLSLIDLRREVAP
jgi:hypothetical protein